jgi:(1->4)-alpha-D-glucan 1-alpha-D-glucosylmutase
MTKALKDSITGAVHSDPQFAAALQAALLSVNTNPKLLSRVLDRQNYRLAYWRSASDEINYRYNRNQGGDQEKY